MNDGSCDSTAYTRNGAASIGWLYELLRISQAVGGPDAAERHHRLLAHIVTGFGGATGCLALRQDNGQLLIAAGIGLPDYVVGRLLDLDEGVLGWAAAYRQPLLLTGDIAGDARFKGRAARTDTQTPRSSLCWPLIAWDGVVGVVSINAAPHGPLYSERDLDSGSAIMPLVSLVVQNAKLHQTNASRLAEEQRAKQALAESFDKLAAAKQQLEQAHEQLLQQEKMASIGQLAAGVAHEINNPVGYVSANIGSLRGYIGDLYRLLDAYRKAEAELSGATGASLAALRSEINLDYLRSDLDALLNETTEGVARVRNIVRDLKNFAHPSEDDWKVVDLHPYIESTLNIACNETKYKATILREFGPLPPIECLPSQLNQVFMNLIVNAAQAIDDHDTITIRTALDDDHVVIEVRDSGCGIPPDSLARIFDPFFTTKPVGQGTGLGLAISYGIVQRHGGDISVESEPGVGTCFRLRLPVKQRRRSDRRLHAEVTA